MRLEKELSGNPEQAPDAVSSALGSGEQAKTAVAVDLLQLLIDDLPEQIALLDESCCILAVNNAWRQTVHQHGFDQQLNPGHNFRDYCARSAAEGYDPAIEALDALDEIALGKLTFWQLDYNARDHWSGRDYRIYFHGFDFGASRFISITRSDLTELLELRRGKKEFPNSLSRERLDERRRLGRELHDSTAQLLTSLTLTLGRLKLTSADREMLRIAYELQELVGLAQKEIRTVTYLAHPPVLDRMSFVDMLTTLAEGFGERTGIGTSVRVEGDPTLFSTEIRSALYRIVQEALSNVHRHSRASLANVDIYSRAGMAHVVVSDDGVGIQPNMRPGVGLAGMRSRLAELDGRLSVRALSPGTAIIASVRHF